MANAIYPIWKQEIIQATANTPLNGSGATGVYCALIDTGVYTYNVADEFWDEGGTDPIDGLVGTAMEVGATKTYVDGVFDGADVTFTAVSGATVEALILYIKNAGAETTHRLFLYLDTSVTGLPVTPNSGDITVTWNGSGIVGL